MNSVPYLWINILFADIAIVLFLLQGAFTAMKAAGMSKERVRQNMIKGGIILFGWMAADIFLGLLGVFRSNAASKFPYIAFGIGLPILIGIWLLLRSETFREILRAMPQQKIVGIQIYRGLGSILLILLGLRLLPGAFAIPAGFGDVFIGFTAILVAGAYMSGAAWRNSLVAAWNVLGILDLVIAVTTGFLSSPGPFQKIALAHPNILVGAYPLVMIPVFAVPLSIVLHASSLTKLTWNTQTNQA